ncbi:MAG: HAMP domain-containing protein [Cyanobacteria bacterium SBLK]|nr:HAMP domain-containing protein [Cyanobacteria bacterium SBLK]
MSNIHKTAIAALSTSIPSASMARFFPKFSIGVKIFAIATSMFAFLAIMMGINYDRIKKVNDELIDLAEYLTPLTAHTTLINARVLKQQIHLERILQLYESEPIDWQQIEEELAAFEKQGQQVDEEIQAAIALSREAIEHAKLLRDIVQFARIEPILFHIEEEHEEFNDRGLQITRSLRTENQNFIDFLEDELQEEEERFNQEVRNLFQELSEFTQRSARNAEREERAILRLNIILMILATGFGMVSAFGLTMGLVNPLKKLLRSTREVERGNLNTKVAIASGDEIEILGNTFNLMVAEIKEKEQIKNTFGQYLDPRIVENLIQQQSKQNIEERQIVTVLFSDVAGFTGISEMLAPEGLVKLLNQYFTLAAEPIARYNGVIDCFIGDALRAFWGEPFVSATEHAQFACFAALEQFEQLARLQRMMPDLMGFRKGLPDFNIRVGLATSEVIAGNIGSEQFKSYTVMGNAVEWAERLEALNKKYGTKILLTEDTWKLAKDAIETREIDMISIGDRQIKIYELLSRKNELDLEREYLRDTFEIGLSAYRDREFFKARGYFETCLLARSDDCSAQIYLEKIDRQSLLKGKSSS